MFKPISLIAVLCLTSSLHAASVSCQLLEKTDELGSTVTVQSSLKLTIDHANQMTLTDAVGTYVFPLIVANKTVPAIGVVSGFKGKQGRGLRASQDSGVVTLRFDSAKTFAEPATGRTVVQGTIKIAGRTFTPSQKILATVVCDQAILPFFKL